MEKQLRILPERVWAMLKALFRRIAGAIMAGVALWAIVALAFYNPYLDGFGAASTFGDQSFMGNVVGFVQYMVGFLPAMFLFMCICRGGFKLLLGGAPSDSPEYDFMRGFITLFIGAAGLGMLMPGASAGGIIGAICANDISTLIGKWAPIPGILLTLVFLIMAGAMLHVRYEHLRRGVHIIRRAVRIALSAFHLMPYEATPDDADFDTEEEESEESDAADEDATDSAADAPAPRRRAARAATRRTARKKGDGDIQYELPDPKLLETSNFGRAVITPELKRTAATMEVHFAEYGVRGKVVGIRPGPIVTLYEFLPDSGTRMNDVTSTVKDMTRAMATENIRIALIPGTQLIGVEMVNLTRQPVRFRSLVANPMFTNSKYKIPLALGVDIGGNPMYYDLAKMPHMLVAGRTGSGKSVFVQSIITSIVYHFTPDKCKLVIIDPKGVDFGFWDDVPHLITPIVKLDPSAAVNALKWAVREMEERYKQLQILNARNIESYNEAAAAKRAAGEVVTRQVAVGTDPETGELLFETQEVDISDMPYIVIIIDEVADLMALARKDVEMCVMRIAQKARAAGIHLVMATQRPDATVITGTIKANFPTRISFQARSNIDSRTTLGEGGAENLLACGDMLFSEGGKAAVRIHGAFIDDNELHSVGNFLRAQGEPEYAAGVTDGDDDASAQSASIPGMPGAAGGGKDDLYAAAKECVLRDKKPTISYIQRRLGIGYNKAATFMERMEAEGIVSAPDANNKRQIL